MGAEIEIGAEIGRWKVVRPIAVNETAAGDVYEVSDINGTHQVNAALKLYHRGLDLADVRGLARAEHRHIIRRIDDGTAFAGPADGRAYLVMELADGTLRSVPERSVAGHLPSALRQILDALIYLHEELRAVHRDVKPDNILRVGDRWKLGDFGLVVGVRSRYFLTEPPAGTLPFLAPEALEGHGTVKLDVFACGVIVQRMLTHVAVWGPESIAQMQMWRPPSDPPYVAREALPPDWLAFVEACLSPLRSRPLAREAQELLPGRSQQAGRNARLSSSGGAPSSVDDLAPTVLEEPVVTAGASRRPATMAAVLIGVVVILLVWALATHKG